MNKSTQEPYYYLKCQCFRGESDDESLTGKSPTLPSSSQTSLSQAVSDDQEPESPPVFYWDRPLKRPLKGMGNERGIYGPDPNVDRIEECGPYILCIRPADFLNDYNYTIRLYHKDSKEVVMAVDSDPPVKVYGTFFTDHPSPESFLPTFFGMCWWWCVDYCPFFVIYNGRLVCRWGGERVTKQLPYERFEHGDKLQ